MMLCGGREGGGGGSGKAVDILLRCLIWKSSHANDSNQTAGGCASSLKLIPPRPQSLVAAVPFCGPCCRFKIKKQNYNYET